MLSARTRPAVNPAGDGGVTVGPDALGVVHRVGAAPASWAGPGARLQRRESRRSAACRSRAASDSWVSAYNVSASLAEPRRSATSLTTSVRRSELMVDRVPRPNGLRGLHAQPFTRTRPPRTAPAAGAPRLEHSRRPEPLVDPDLIHGAMIAVARGRPGQIGARARNGSDTVVTHELPPPAA